MLPFSLLMENTVQSDGVGPSISVSRGSGKLLVLTLGITRALEQESLEISIWGSSDGVAWGVKPLATFPQKFYCGLYSILLNLAARPDVRNVRVQWKIKKLGKRASTPLFSFYVDAEESGSRVQTAVA